MLRVGFEPTTPWASTKCYYQTELPQREVPSGGFEPPTPGAEDRRSDPLSYEGIVWEEGFEPPRSKMADLQSAEPTSCSTPTYMKDCRSWSFTDARFLYCRIFPPFGRLCYAYTSVRTFINIGAEGFEPPKNLSDPNRALYLTELHPVKHPVGFEPTTACLQGRCSGQLS